mmetsp:Transcript_54235/g.129254  ORF Transcript_54235/g.129254 Transcript_54235/m.129254 type:complete len:735 (-) Transcript_54235:86-2290(-)
MSAGGPTCGYTAVDVAQALQRLSAIAASRQDPGLQTVAAEELQQRWQVVANVAGNGYGEVSGVELEHLKAIFSYIEAVIISCGAPDSFDVYEVCFEALTKMGFFLQTLPAKELLLQVLETVHEVYDVLLSCVETYEWVQPGTTGSLRLWMLQVIFSCFGFSNITGRHLMELTDNDVSGAVSLVSFVLRCSEAPFEMQDCAGRCLVELTTADSVFLDRVASGDGIDWQNEQIAKLTGMLNRHVNGLIKGIIQFDVVEAFGRCICQHQLSHARTDVIVKHFLATIHNSLLYCSENQKKLRQHLACQSTIVQDIMIPYLHNILPALYDHANPGPTLIEWQNLKSTLQTFVVVSFNINVFRPQLRDTDLILQVCQVPHILEHISMLELLMKIAVNVDFTRGPYFANIQQTLQGAYAVLTPDNSARLQRRMTADQSMRLPYSRANAKAVEALSFAIQPLSQEQAAAQDVKRKSKMRIKAKIRKRKKLFAMKNSKTSAVAAQEAAEDAEDEDSEEDDMPPLVGDFPLQQATCALTGNLMTDPVQTPDGNFFERVALEDYVTQNQVNPVTGAPMSMAECQQATPEMQAFIKGCQLQMLAAYQIEPEAFEEPLAEPQAPAPAAPVGAPGAGPKFLSDLPALPTAAAEAAAPSQKKEKAKIRIESRSVVDCPEDMRCAIDGKVMTNPVRSPYGHAFEKKTLEKWMANCGSVCPITGRPLRLEECQPDGEIKKRIVKFLRGQQV